MFLDYADYLDNIYISFTIRFLEPLIKSGFEESQVIKAIGYGPIEAIFICGFLDHIFYVAEEILKRFSGYLLAEVPEDVIPTIKGKVFKILIEYEDNPPTMLSHYHLLDTDFVVNYFNVRRDPAVLKIFSLDIFKTNRKKLKDLLSKESKN